MASSGLQNYQKIKNCAENVEQYMPLEIAINASRAAMYKAIQPNPGYFPHIFLDGHHQFNNTWTSLLRTLCRGSGTGDSRSAKSAACATRNGIQFSFDVDNVNAMLLKQHSTQLAEAINLGVNLATSESAFPVHWRTDDGSSTAPPSYVNVRASNSSSVVSIHATNNTEFIHIQVLLVDVLSEFVDDLVVGCNGNGNGNVTTYVQWALKDAINGFVGSVHNAQLHL